MGRYNKYLVLKIADIEKYLSDQGTSPSQDQRRAELLELTQKYRKIIEANDEGID